MSFIKNTLRWWKQPKKTYAEEILEFAIFIVFIFAVRTWIFGLYQVPSGSMETTMLVGEGYFSDKFTYRFIRAPRRGEIIAFNEPTFDYSSNTVQKLWQMYVWGPSNWTKRVIGLPGEHVEGKMEDGKPVVYINGEKFEEPYLNKYPLVPVSYDLTQGWRSYDANYAYDKQPFYRMDETTVRTVQRALAQHGHDISHDPQTPLIGSQGNLDVYDVHLKCKEKDGVDEYWVMGDNRLGSGDCRSWGPLKADLIHGRILFRIFSVDAQHSWLIVDLLTHPIDFWTRIRFKRFFNWIG